MNSLINKLWILLPLGILIEWFQTTDTYKDWHNKTFNKENSNYEQQTRKNRTTYKISIY